MSPESQMVLPGTITDPKAIAFLEKLKEKTTQQKIKWHQFEKGFMATLPNLFAVFIFSTTKAPYQWNTMVVQATGETIFQVRKTIPDALTEFIPPDPAQKAVGDIYAYITAKLANPLDKAIESLDKL